ncbi:phage/plasmid primase, P4 family [Corynebacterium silvaticum]|uniref:phage/plasmid primase, P4 family n=1 Tax=Corynebacterium silvaticum TaxID=2320431 RepID=UPI00148F1208|nr:phage/plasmid primase, P4 family [Corynebacterium silvaticum]NON70318.1 DNA primase [Corynebacterium silvaticum]UWH00832.1 primase C-terminal domain-containing protein [Corynebacterium silvaticum]UWH02880.1 primase C-terminal domain-containing protein [Corynebacterium silvaticum]UXZ27079.1 primase C-terminal domain-containing protein [Corynebacterium silvaticum]UXZ29107.1 primase C-terminal domain-containing protein [Corynebacterium silvaticum]
MTPFTLCAATSSGNAHNNHYPNHHHITDQTGLGQVTQLDHVAATYTGDRRSSASFISSDCVVMDIDNDHTDNPADWITSETLGELMAGVVFMTATSRNNQKPKGALSARPRFHVYFPINPVTDAEVYAGLKRRLATRFGFFDSQALDAGRFIYGTINSHITVHDGTKLLDAWLDEADEIDVFAAFDASTQVIGEGSRNAILSRFAGRVLIRYGQTAQARDLFDRKASLCEPPLSDHELESIWGSACRFAAKVEAQPGYLSPEAYAELTSLRPDDLTDVGQATILAGEYAGRICYSPATAWMAYENGVWEENEPKVQHVVQELTTRQLEQAQTELDQVTERAGELGVTAMLVAMSKTKALAAFSREQARAYHQMVAVQEWMKFIYKCRSDRTILAVMRQARPLALIDPQVLDADPYLLNTPSATFDLRDGSRRDHDPSDMVTKQTAVDPTDQGKQMWLDALNVTFGGDAELIGYVQRVCGLAAIGKVLIEALIIAYGDGRNGKSTFWNTIARVLGNYSGSISADALTVGVRRNVKPELAEARGKRLLIAAETEEGMRLSTSNVKQLASTDEISAEKKFKDPFAFTPSHTLILYTNHLPRVGAMDAGIWRRLIVIPFEAKIEGSSDIKNYADYLYQHAGGAILAWIMDGARLIHTEDYHLNPPRQVVEASAAYREDNDWFTQFLEDSCDVDPGLSERAGDLYQTYRAWAQNTAGWARPMMDFNSAVEQAGYVRKKTRNGMFVHGLAIKSEFDTTH